jgi:putative membrane protein
MNQTRALLGSALAGVGLWLAAQWPASAQERQANPDQAFLEEAARSNVGEIELGKLARDRAARAEIRKFAQMMIDDHRGANRELTNLADNKGVSLPKRMSKKDRALYDRLADRRGIDFDIDYIRRMVAAHVVTVGKFEAEARDGRDVDVRAYANKNLPALREHLRQARALADRIKPAPAPERR